jgi:Right handed beta helix region
VAKKGKQMKIQVLFALSTVLAGVLSGAAICTVYAQGGQVREIGLAPASKSPDTAVQTSSEVQLPIRITEPGNYRLNTNLVGITPNTVISIESSDVTLDLNGFSISGGGPGIVGSGRNIAISNGSVNAGDGFGVSLSETANCSIERLRITGRDGIALVGIIGGDGIVLAGTNCIVKNNTVEAVRIGISCSGCVVSGNTVTVLSNFGIKATDSSLVVANRATGNIALGADDTTGYGQNVLHGTTADVTGGVQIGENLCVTSRICQP